jgi:hypothetical protein
MEYVFYRSWQSPTRGSTPAKSMGFVTRRGAGPRRPGGDPGEERANLVQARGKI